MYNYIFKTIFLYLFIAFFSLLALKAQAENTNTQIVISSSWKYRDRILYIITPEKRDSLLIDNTSCLIKINGKGQIKIGVGIKDRNDIEMILLNIDGLRPSFYFNVDKLRIKEIKKPAKASKKVERFYTLNGNFIEKVIQIPKVKENSEAIKIAVYIPWKYRNRIVQIVSNSTDFIPLDNVQANFSFFGKGEAQMATCVNGRKPKWWIIMQINAPLNEIRMAKVKRSKIPKKWRVMRINPQNNEMLVAKTKYDKSPKKWRKWKVPLENTYFFKIKNKKLKLKRYRKRKVPVISKSYYLY